MVEIGCIELVNRFPTGQTFHRYLNPERDIPAEAFAVHGLSAEFLKDKPRFADVAEDFLTFSATRRWSSTTRRSISASSMPSSSAPARPRHRPRAAGRHAAARAPQASGRAEPAGRPVRALRHRQFAPHQARRAARCRAPCRGLYRADRRAAGHPHPGRYEWSERAGHGRDRGVACSRHAAAPAGDVGGPRRPSRLHRHPRRRRDLERISGGQSGGRNRPPADRCKPLTRTHRHKKKLRRFTGGAACFFFNAPNDRHAVCRPSVYHQSLAWISYRSVASAGWKSKPLSSPKNWSWICIVGTLAV